MKDHSRIEGKLEDLGDIYFEKHDKQAGAQKDILEWILGETDSPLDDMEISGRPLTEDEIKQAIDILENSKSKIPEYSYFGDANWRNIEAQIDILKWVLS